MVRDQGIVIDESHKYSSQRVPTCRLQKTVDSTSPEIILPLYKAVVRSHPECAVQIRSLSLAKDHGLMKNGEQRFTKITYELTDLPYVDRLRAMSPLTGRHR